MIAPSPLPSLDRDLVLDFLRNRRQVVLVKNGETVPYDDLPPYLKGQEDLLHEFLELVETGEFDLEATQEARQGVPDLDVKFDEVKMRADAEATIKALGITPLEAPR